MFLGKFPASAAMPVRQDLKTLCKELDKFQVAAAIGHLTEAHLIVWNQCFATLTTLSQDELQMVSLSSIVRWEGATRDLAGGGNSEGTAQALPFKPCVLRPPEPAGPILGKSIQRADGYTLIILDPGKGSETEKGAGSHLLGMQEQAQRARRLIHDEVSPELLAASFGAHTVGEKLKARQAPESEEMSQVIQNLDLAIQRLIAAFSGEAVIASA